MSNTEYKNFIFVTGNTNSDYRSIGVNLSYRLQPCVNIFEPDPTLDDVDGATRINILNSSFFSQVQFYGGLPSRQNVFIIVPNLTIRTILQILVLFESMPKKVFIVVDDRHCVNPCARGMLDVYKKFPHESVFYLSDIFVLDVITELVHRIQHNSKFTSASTINAYNEILTKIPEVFRDEIKKSIFETAFGDVPYTKLTQSLLSKFNKVANEDDDDDDELKEIQTTKAKITDYFKPEENKENEDPQETIKEEVVDEQTQPWISIFDDNE